MVPNVPCGVESLSSFRKLGKNRAVPNVPCGVESATLELLPLFPQVFLMYRVELKGYKPAIKKGVSLIVPNVPCGVERAYSDWKTSTFGGFLMYRVELKVWYLLFVRA